MLRRGSQPLTIPGRCPDRSESAALLLAARRGAGCHGLDQHKNRGGDLTILVDCKVLSTGSVIRHRTQPHNLPLLTWNNISNRPRDTEGLCQGCLRSPSPLKAKKMQCDEDRTQATEVRGSNVSSDSCTTQQVWLRGFVKWRPHTETSLPPTGEQQGLRRGARKVRRRLVEPPSHRNHHAGSISGASIYSRKRGAAMVSGALRNWLTGSDGIRVEGAGAVSLETRHG